MGHAHAGMGKVSLGGGNSCIPIKSVGEPHFVWPPLVWMRDEEPSVDTPQTHHLLIFIPNESKTNAESAPAVSPNQSHDRLGWDGAGRGVSREPVGPGRRAICLWASSFSTGSVSCSEARHVTEFPKRLKGNLAGRLGAGPGLTPQTSQTNIWGEGRRRFSVPGGTGGIRC